MKVVRLAQFLGIVLCAVSLVLVFALAPSTAGWWQKTLACVFAVGFAMRVVALLSGGGPLGAGKPALLAWSSALPMALLAVASLGLPQTWAWILGVASWLWSFSTRKMWQP